MIKQAEKLPAYKQGAGEHVNHYGTNNKKYTQADPVDEKKLRTLLEQGKKGERADKDKKAHLTSTQYTQHEKLADQDVISLEIQSRLFQQNLAKSSQIQTQPSGKNQAWTEFVVNKIQSNLPGTTTNTSIQINLPPDQLNGSNILLNRDSQGVMNITFMVGSLAVSNQLQKDLPMLKKELEKKMPGSKIALQIKQELQVPRYLESDDAEQKQVY